MPWSPLERPVCSFSTSATQPICGVWASLTRPVLPKGWPSPGITPRRFGLAVVTHTDELAELPQLRHLGVDPFSETLTGEYLFSFTRASDRRIRDLLLDQQIVAGLGNIYANEVLALVRVKPTTRAYRLTRKQIGMIAAAIPELLHDAIQWCGTSFSDYRDADDKSGEFQNHLRVYDRHGEPCRLCPNTIKRVAIGNRSAFYCPTCQK